ncbi:MULTISPECIES: SgcJ/EcaC family oxidoreductase [Pseudomonas syringae group]|nr:SgcJ/EcaC family oxidoreductase [Pseudomonas viridiflava]MBD8569008.1 SgcJ/EcaC family oxidoreductase [Pseudomonas syringae]KIQ27035.1 cag pathogenicity island protein Cag5 [Pseudomonas viridiflava]MEE4097331.1 SgcJ/EcaC family oxidoreductase [Pseudomonas viridiflava]MEE4180435.1 SgcJ/EcaC family oxidoreductase [Pseudomonas viridiflava]MEE4232034.1 SgcJ/EcaC family oxidoreductase [Pseudomonas viridiflava]
MKLKLTALALFLAVSAPMVQAAAEPAGGYTYRMVAEQPNSVNDKEIAGLFDRWNKALKTGNPQTVVSLYAKDAVLQPTVSNKVRANPAEIKDYFEHFLALKPVGEINYREIRRLGPDAAVDSGVYTFTLTSAEGKQSKVQARYTFLYHRIGNEWKILNHHSSAMPEVQPEYQVSR